MACWSVNPARSALAICCSASASWPLNRATRRRRSQRTSAAGAKNPAVAAAAPQKAPARQVLLLVLPEGLPQHVERQERKEERGGAREQEDGRRGHVRAPSPRPDLRGSH